MYTFLATFFLFYVAFADNIVGQKCILKNKMPGHCTRSHKCPTAINEWYQGIMPEVCGFAGSKPIVCCPDFHLPKIPKSIMKCAEYGAIIPEIRKRQKRNLVGGSLTLPQEYSHMAALGYIDGMSVIWKCAGSLISDQYVLTVAHCLEDRQYGYVQYVRLGDYNLSSPSPDTQAETYRIESRIGHPGYMRNMHYNDVALIKLEKPVTFSRFIHPACMDTRPNVVDKTLTALAWGPSLMKVDLDVFSESKCRGVYIAQRSLEVGIVTDSQFCAGGLNELKDTCRGDSGGPLVSSTIYHDKLYNIVGLTSFGTPCGSLGQPGVYTKVSHYVPWIESIIWPSSYRKK